MDGGALLEKPVAEADLSRICKRLVKVLRAHTLPLER
jgi:hypothetical protein